MRRRAANDDEENRLFFSRLFVIRYDTKHIIKNKNAENGILNHYGGSDEDHENTATRATSIFVVGFGRWFDAACKPATVRV